MAGIADDPIIPAAPDHMAYKLGPAPNPKEVVLTRAEHQAVLRVLRMMDEYLEAPAQTPALADMMRKHIAGAIAIVESNPPRGGRG